MVIFVGASIAAGAPDPIKVFANYAFRPTVMVVLVNQINA